MAPYPHQALLLVAGLLLTAPAPAQRLNDTGQIICYNGSTSTGTVSTGTPDPETAGHDEQDCTRGAAAADALERMVKVGASTAPGRDYTKIANDGSELPASAVLGSGAGDWACTRDNITGLIWEVRSDDNGLRDMDWSYTWYDTNGTVNGGIAGTLGTSSTCNSTLPNCNTTAYRDAINELSGSNRLCGASDWRLPTPIELRSLLHLGRTSAPYIDASWIANTVNSSYWTATTSARVLATAWSVSFFDGSLNTSGKSSSLQVLLVRGGQ